METTISDIVEEGIVLASVLRYVSYDNPMYLPVSVLGHSVKNRLLFWIGVVRQITYSTSEKNHDC